MNPKVFCSKDNENNSIIGQGLINRLKKVQELNTTQKLRTDAWVFIFNREEDTISPLVFSWSYFALIWEIVGIKDGVAELSLEDWFNLSNFFDNFYRENFNKNFSELAQNLKGKI